MAAFQSSLHAVVDKWLAPSPARPVGRVLHGRMAGNRARYVRVEAIRAGEGNAMMFFKHDDGSWQVFPPAATRMMMSAQRLAM